MDIAVPGARRVPRVSPGSVARVAREARRYPVIPVLILLLVLVIPAAFAPWIAPHDPERGTFGERLTSPVWSGPTTIQRTIVSGEPQNRLAEITVGSAQGRARQGKLTSLDGTALQPDQVAPGMLVSVVVNKGGSWTNVLGTDGQGRDILSRILHGAKFAIIVSLTVILIAGVIGVSLGLVAGYFGGKADAIVMRMVDIALAIPIILLALALVASQGPAFKWVILVIVAVLWSRYARQVRGETLALRHLDFVARARVSGCSHFRIIVRHILPNVANSIVVLTTLQVGVVILLEASLSFLGAGIPPPKPAWGLMVADGRDQIAAAWWVSFFPGLAILLVVLSFNLLGDWLRDRLDPKQRNL